jgi:carboxyl-terminal processing protease
MHKVILTLVLFVIILLGSGCLAGGQHYGADTGEIAQPVPAIESGSLPEEQLRIFRAIFVTVKTDYVNEVDERALFDNAIRGLWKTVGVTTEIPQPPADVLSGGGEKVGSGPAAVDRATLKRFVWAYTEIKRRYGAIDDNKLIEAAIQEMLAGLDSQSRYLNPLNYKEARVGTAGSGLGAIGIEATMEEGLLRIVAPFEDTPAARAGLKPGDLIVRLDDKTVKGMSLAEAMKHLRGKPGSDITLTVVRDGEPEALKFTITRAIIRIQSVKSRLLEPGYGYLRITQFRATTDTTLRAALAKLETENNGKLKGLVLDLRNNRGGVLNAAVAVSDTFLRKGLIVYTDGRIANSKLKFTATPSDALDGAPIVVLVNGASAGGAEIVAAALRDNDRAVIIGSGTFGLGVIQTIIPMSNGGAFKLTTARYYTPLGQPIQGQGVEPDVCVQGDRVQAEGGACPKRKRFYQEAEPDVELRMALEILKDRRRYQSII